MCRSRSGSTRGCERVKAAIASIPSDGWVTIQYTDAVYDETAQRWISRLSRRDRLHGVQLEEKADQLPCRLVVRRIPDLNPHLGQDSLSDSWRFHAPFTTSSLTP